MLDVKGKHGPLPSDQDDCLRDRMADREFLHDVRIQPRHVGDDQIIVEEKLQHLRTCAVIESGAAIS